MGGDYFGGSPDLHAAGVLQFLQQRAAVLGAQRARRRCVPGRELIDARADGVRARGIEGLAGSVPGVDADELTDGALQALKQRQIDVEAERGYVLSARVLDADGRALGLPAVGEGVGVIRDDLRVVRVGDAGQAEFGRGLTDLPPGEVVVDRHDRVLRICEVVQHDLTEGSEGLAQPLRDLLQLIEQNLPVRGFCPGSGGGTVALAEEEIVAALRRLARQGLFAEPTSASAAAALAKLSEAGSIKSNETTVVLLTGNGLKAASTIADLVQ